MSGNIHYDGRTIGYSVIYNRRLLSKIRIHTYPNGSVTVESPLNRSDNEIHAAVQKRARWVNRQLERSSAARHQVLPREYISGETHFYLGRRYQLKIIETVSLPSSVILKKGQIQITVRCADPASIRRRLNVWYREKAEDYFKRRLAEISLPLLWLENEPPIKLATMHKQWGSCSPSGRINLNPLLIKAPRECIDYVIMHELCHLRERNHSKNYYNLLEKNLPDWQQIKLRLDGMGELLLAT